MSLVSLRACLRIARRDARRSPGRSLLVLSMVALPVVGMTSADVLYRTAQLDPTETVARDLGNADVVIAGTGTSADRVTQNPDGSTVGFMGSAADGAHPAAPPPITTSARLVPGARRWVIETTTSATVRTASGGQRPVQWRALAYDDPMLRGVIRQLEGRPPTGADEVALTRELARSLSLRVGDPITTAAGQRYRVAGIVVDPHALDAQTVLSQPAAAPKATGRMPELPPRAFVDTVAPVTWPQVLVLNQHGLIAVSRAVLLDPPPPSQIPGYDPTYARNVRLAIAGVVLLVVGLATLEVVLLAGAAFAVERVGSGARSPWSAWRGGTCGRCGRSCLRAALSSGRSGPSWASHWG